MKNYKQIYAINQKQQQRILNICPEITEQSGIYIFYRQDEYKINHCYVGQAKNLLQRTAQHLNEYDRIGLSLKKRGFYTEDNIYGWKLIFKEYSVDVLDQAERLTIIQMANQGYQLYNVTIGGQNEGKNSFDGKTKSGKNYHDGLKQGYANAQKEVANLFEKHLNYSKKSDKPNKNQEKAMQKFADFLSKTVD